VAKYNSGLIDRDTILRRVPELDDDDGAPCYRHEARRVIVCLCGSTRFPEAFQRANYDETMAGKIVLSVGFYPHASKQVHGQDVGCTDEQKVALDLLHKDKIDLADEILVLNVGGYVGDSTRSEVVHALKHGKTVRWLERDRIPDDLRDTVKGGS